MQATYCLHHTPHPTPHAKDLRSQLIYRTNACEQLRGAKGLRKHHWLAALWSEGRNCQKIPILTITPTNSTKMVTSHIPHEGSMFTLFPPCASINSPCWFWKWLLPAHHQPSPEKCLTLPRRPSEPPKCNYKSHLALVSKFRGSGWNRKKTCHPALWLSP